MIVNNLSDSEGVYYHANDYAGFWRRILVDAIDASIVIAFCSTLTFVITEIFEPTESIVSAIFLFWLTIFFMYFVLLKGSNFRTIGYRVGKLKVVNLKGDRPSIFALTFRLLISSMGPLNNIIDLIWLSGDENKQAIRDKFAKTYVVKINAMPAGIGKLTYSTYEFLAYRLIFCEVKRPAQAKTTS